MGEERELVITYCKLNAKYPGFNPDIYKGVIFMSFYAQNCFANREKQHLFTLMKELSTKGLFFVHYSKNTKNTSSLTDNTEG